MTSAKSISLRARLSFWLAAILFLVVVVFSAGIFLFTKERIYRALDLQLGRNLTGIEKVYRAEPGELNEVETQIGMDLFEVVENGKMLYRTIAWSAEGLAGAIPGELQAAQTWTAPDGQHFRVARIAGPNVQISAALDESPIRLFLSTLGWALIVGVSCVAGLALLGGYFLAGRLLSPIGAMAETAGRITANSLGERLPVGNPGDEFGLLATVLNNSLSRVQASFEQLRKFTADVSHELRTPLTAMRSVGEVALQKPLGSAGYRDVIGSMLEEVDHLTRLVESLLALTRTEAGGIRIARENTDLCSLTADVVSQLRVLAEEKGQELRIDSASPVFATCDPNMLRRGVMNTLHNAIKYTPRRGAISVTVRTASSSEAAIEIRDTGPGISAEHRARIFDRFYRADDGRSRVSGGFGLGLAIAQGALHSFGGRIELESEAGKGSLFRIVVPLDPGRTPGACKTLI